MKNTAKMKEDFYDFRNGRNISLPGGADVEEEWAGPLVVTRGQVYDTWHCPGLIAVTRES